MGIIISKKAWIASAATVGALYFGFNPFHAFLIGGFGAFVVLSLLLGWKPGSQTAMVSSMGAIAAFSFFGISAGHSFLLAVTTGYLYLYWWLFFMPRLLK